MTALQIRFKRLNSDPLAEIWFQAFDFEVSIFEYFG